MDSEPTDKDLLSQLSTDPAAFETFYWRHLDRVIGFTARRVREPADVADVVAATFLTVLTAARSYDPGRGEPTAWLQGITARLIARENRRRYREHAATARIIGRRLIDASDIERLEERIDAARSGQQAIEALSQLKPKAREVRRPADLLLAVFSLLIVAVVLGSIRALPLGSTEVADDVSGWLLRIPRWLSFAAEVVAGVACFVLVIAALVVLARSQWRDARNAVAAGLAGGAAAIIASGVWRAEHGAVEHSVLHGNPSMFVVDTAFVAFVVGTDLARRSHWSRWWLRSAAALLLGGLAVGTLTPFAMAIVLFGGLLIGWTVRWLLGADSVLPRTAELMSWLTSQGVQATDLSVPDSRSRARLEGVLADGTRIRMHLSGRDTRGSGLARQLWALARLRPAVAGHVALGSRDRLEQFALACCLAQQAGVDSPAVLLLGEMPGETLVLVTTIPDGGTGGGVASRAAATSLFASLRRLHDTGIAHHDLRLENLFMSRNGAGFCSLDAAEPGAGELARRLDLVQVLATLASPVGPADAVTALRAGYGPFDQAAVAAVLQPLALAPWGWRAMRAAQGSLNEIRHELLGAGGVVPTARLERFRWRTVASAVALTVAAYLLIGEISGVNVLGTLSRADPGWLAVAVLGSAVTYLAAAENLAAFVPGRLSIWRGFCVQLSTAFVGVAMPPTVGHVHTHVSKVRDLIGRDALLRSGHQTAIVTPL